MKIPNILLPTILKIEKGIFNNITNCFNNIINPNDKAIFITDEILFEIYGKPCFNNINSFFNSVQLKIILNSSIEESFNLSKEILNNEIKIIIGLGGGRVLDVCKHAAFMTKSIFVSIPTTLSNDGVASPIAVLKTEKGYKSIGCSIPEVIIIDLDIVKSSPIELRKAGVGDILSNYTALLDWHLAVKRNKEIINDFAAIISETAFNSILNCKVKDFNNDGFIRQLSESIVLSGLAMNIAGSSRPCSGSEHLISHSMDLFNRNNLHGIQVAISSIISASLHNKDIKILKEYLNHFEIPTHINEIGFSKEDFIIIMQKAKQTRIGRYTILDETDLSEKNIGKIYDSIF